MAENDNDKTQDPTPHRREQAREEGQVIHSQDLGSAALLLAGLVALLFLGAPLAHFLGRLMVRQLGGEPWLSTDAGSLMALWRDVWWDLAAVLLPILGMMLLAAVASNFLQFGFLFLPQKAAPDWSRVNPWSGLLRLVSLPNFVRLAFGVFKIVIVATVALASLYHRREEILSLADLDTMQIALLAWDISLATSLRIAGALLVLALLDFGFQWWKHEQDLRMTPQEVREEMRNLQGDPQVLARRRNVQRQLAANRLTSAVPKADVVITNPTELAIALQYDPDTMNAPVVVAKGAGILAQRIRQLAALHGIPIVEKKPLAQALYREVDLNKPILDKLYSGVAEVLAYVYQLKGKSLPGAA